MFPKAWATLLQSARLEREVTNAEWQRVGFARLKATAIS